MEPTITFRVYQIPPLRLLFIFSLFSLSTLLFVLAPSLDVASVVAAAQHSYAPVLSPLFSSNLPQFALPYHCS